ncbi:MAG: hypothetical protein QXF82_06970 [Nitrososphaeria archaeon]
MTGKIVEKVPGWVEKFLLPNLESRIQSIVQKEIDRVMKLEDKINSIDKRLSVIENNPFIVASSRLSVKYISGLLEGFEKSISGGNPLTPEELRRRKELTLKLDAKTITPDEAKELQNILEKELAEAQAANNVLALLAILLLLGLVVAALSD